jgi:hypothetical protein
MVPFARVRLNSGLMDVVAPAGQITCVTRLEKPFAPWCLWGDGLCGGSSGVL